MTPRYAAVKLLQGLSLFGALSLGSSSAGFLLVWYGWYAVVNQCTSAVANGPCSLSSFLASEPFLVAFFVLGAGFTSIGLFSNHRRRRFVVILLVLFVLGFISPFLNALIPTSTSPPAIP